MDYKQSLIDMSKLGEDRLIRDKTECSESRDGRLIRITRACEDRINFEAVTHVLDREKLENGVQVAA